MQPSRSVTIPLCIAGAITLWVVSVIFRVLAILRDGANPWEMTPFTLDAIASAIMPGATIWLIAYLLHRHRQKMVRILAEQRELTVAAVEESSADARAAIIEAVGIQILMSRSQTEAEAEDNVRRLPRTRV